MGWTTTRKTRQEVEIARMAFTTVSGNSVMAVRFHVHGDESWFLYYVFSADEVLIEKRIVVMIWEGDSYKEISEAAQPYFFNCPVSWFDEVPEPLTPDGFRWRDMVRKVTEASAVTA